MSSKLKGLEDFKKKVQSLSQISSVPFAEMLNPSFISRCSRFENVQEFFDASNFAIQSPEDFKAIPDDEWDTFVRENTSYSNWESMLKDAGGEWVKSKLKA
jgi:hypothetical protein